MFQGETMNKSELIKALSEQKKMHVDEATKVVGAFVDSVKEALLRGDRVEIRGFGSFKIKDYEGYTGRNPRPAASFKSNRKNFPSSARVKS